MITEQDFDLKCSEKHKELKQCKTAVKQLWQSVIGSNEEYLLRSKLAECEALIDLFFSYSDALELALKPDFSRLKNDQKKLKRILPFCLAACFGPIFYTFINNYGYGTLHEIWEIKLWLLPIFGVLIAVWVHFSQSFALVASALETNYEERRVKQVTNQILSLCNMRIDLYLVGYREYANASHGFYQTDRELDLRLCSEKAQMYILFDYLQFKPNNALNLDDFYEQNEILFSDYKVGKYEF